jgi:hypothetical protein
MSLISMVICKITHHYINEYLDYWNLDTGYMLSFNFNQKKEQGVKRVQIGDKVLYEGTV